MARKAGVYGAKGVKTMFRKMVSAAARPVAEAERFAMQPILKASKANTPHASVKKALVLKTSKKAPKNKPTVLVGGDPSNPDYRLLHLLELGTEPHPVNHPGTSPQPFMTPAFTQHSAEAIKRFGEKIGPAMEKQAARLAKKAGLG